MYIYLNFCDLTNFKGCKINLFPLDLFFDMVYYFICKLKNQL